MSFFDYFKSLKSSELRLAWAVALAADALQIAALPLFAAGALSPADDVLDVVVGAILVRLLGWHWAFLPSLVAELVPGLDLFPTWTAAVWYVTRNAQAFTQQATGEHIGPGAEPEFLPPEPAPGKAAASRWRR
jgi:hypothetical protein